MPSSRKDFVRVARWLEKERHFLQLRKFDYTTEGDKPLEYWEGQINKYVGRLKEFEPGTVEHTQAALKLAAVTVAYAEHQAKSEVVPEPAQPSGELKLWKRA